MRVWTTKGIWIVLGVWLVFFSCQSEKKKEVKEESTSGLTPVKVIKVKKDRISEKLFYTGVIQPWEKINITPEIGGKIAKIYVEEGEKVKKGQLLAELETRSLRLQMEQAKASLAVAKANFKDAQRNLERMERLVKEKAVSTQQYEKVKLAYDSAGANLEQAKAAFRLAQYNLEVSQMKAPFNGVVASLNAEEGDVINPMMGGFSPQSGVLTLMDFSRIKINVDTSYQNVIRIHKGQSALLKVEGLEEEVRGEVSMVGMTANPESKKFKVEIEAHNPDLELRPNTFGEVIIEISTRPQALVIPQKAILENKYVFLAEDNRAKREEVVLGLQNSEMVEVVKGLQEGDLVIVEGNYGLVEGALIEIKEVVE